MKEDLTPKQVDAIVNHYTEAEKWGFDDAKYWPWQIDNRKHALLGHTLMDNFDMREFMTAIGVDTSKVTWSYS
jgi:hypothetical protein